MKVATKASLYTYADTSVSLKVTVLLSKSTVPVRSTRSSSSNAISGFEAARKLNDVNSGPDRLGSKGVVVALTGSDDCVEF